LITCYQAFFAKNKQTNKKTQEEEEKSLIAGSLIKGKEQ